MDAQHSQFGNYKPPNKREEWAALKSRLSLGQSVSGKVVQRESYGAWIDIGVGFPALLLLPRIRDLTGEQYRKDDWLPIGSIVEARLISFADQEHSLVITQKDEEPF